MSAQRIREGTHRVSTAEEIAAYHADQRRRTADKHTKDIEKLVHTHEAAQVAAGRIQSAEAEANKRVKDLKPKLKDRLADPELTTA